ncbi:hypothetical protein LSAT2_028281, partial [Lamellibrachia satsuma]
MFAKDSLPLYQPLLKVCLTVCCYCQVICMYQFVENVPQTDFPAEHVHYVMNNRTINPICHSSGIFPSLMQVYFLLVPLVVAQQSTLKLYGTGSFIMYIVLIAVLLVNCFIGYMNPQCPCACVGSLLEGTFDPCKDSCKDSVDPCKDSEDPRKSFSKGNLKGSSKKDCRKEGKKEPKKGGK